ncbi:hypothetical protein L218DRAFT_948422 [Marasmius fiardii PR-910]|nr:hypothetical protein L218DRAFT_948422 [Marasmius fiardii PR-910]
MRLLAFTTTIVAFAVVSVSAVCEGYTMDPNIPPSDWVVNSNCQTANFSPLTGNPCTLSGTPRFGCSPPPIAITDLWMYNPIGPNDIHGSGSCPGLGTVERCGPLRLRAKLATAMGWLAAVDKSLITQSPENEFIIINRVTSPRHLPPFPTLPLLRACLPSTGHRFLRVHTEPRLTSRTLGGYSPER